MTNLAIQQPSIKAFRPFIICTPDNYEATKAFYSELFEKAFDDGDSACGFKTGIGDQDFLVTLHYNIDPPKNAMMQFWVDDPQAWYDYMVAKKLDQRHPVTITPPVETSWGWLITYVADPAGVKLHFGKPNL